ncbi:MAG TPA: UDP-3-O-acyl-N-acetylglucosamine deacetylase, partial [Segetibacter sp.]
MNSNGQSFQHTIDEEISISGAGIHTGQSVTIHIKPSSPNTGINFQRVDLPGKPTVKADVDFVVETNRSTTLENNGARVSTVEHL